MTSPDKIATFQSKILTWYKDNKRDLPWRTTTNPYHILVSEVMLQQTQVDRVIPYYQRWLKVFSTPELLAQASKEQVLRHWSGLGYNHRALRLQQLAKAIAGKPFPETEEELMKLPGIGPYTARAILAFAFNRAVPVIDTNIRRVLIHELGLPEDVTMKELEQTAVAVIPPQQSCIWHNALMDYGALLATAKKTGIKPLSQQSKFEGSERQIRGKIVRLLLQEREVTVQKLRSEMNDPRLIKIMEQMRREGILQKKGTRWSF
ncbi:A/G-specific adenine glycosylase [Candidatus Woesearchaeota archaeon]|nr:A/G-specific adenine glycosylase [Candidatus Woesearchaeota archaeon]